MKDRPPPNVRSPAWRILGLMIAIALTGAVLWSIWFETLLPLLRAGDERSLRPNLIGIPLMLLGAALLVYGGILFVDRTGQALRDPAFHERAHFVRTDHRPNARWEAWKMNLRSLFRLWLWPLILLAVALAMIGLGGMLTNL